MFNYSLISYGRIFKETFNDYYRTTYPVNINLVNIKQSLFKFFNNKNPNCLFRLGIFMSVDSRRSFVKNWLQYLSNKNGFVCK